MVASGIADNLRCYRENAFCKMRGIGGIPNLVVDDADFRLIVCEPQHCLDKVISEGAVDPRRPKDDMSLADIGDVAFPFELGLSIDTKRGRLIVLSVGSRQRAIEHIICRNVDERYVPPRACFCHATCAFGV